MLHNPVIASQGRKLRLAVIGGGPSSFIGTVHRGAALLEEHYEVVASVLSSDPIKSVQYAKDIGIPRGYASAEALFETEVTLKDKADVIAIMTPNNSHFDLVNRALELGFHVMCEKPLTNKVDEALSLVNAVRKHQRECCIAFAYSGYPMIRQAQAMIQAGELGEIRMVQSEYVQGHLAALTQGELEQSNWHMKPDMVGPSLILGDIGTHCYHLAAFVVGREPSEICADIATLVPDRAADDYTGILMRYANGARGSFVITQSAAGADHGLYLRVFGEKGGIEWHQEQPNQLIVRWLDEPTQVLQKGGKGLHEAAKKVSRIAVGHPEGYREAFANLYTDLAEAIVDRENGKQPRSQKRVFPTIEEGAQGVRFVDAALRSHQQNGSWVAIPAAQDDL
ncbi:Gfo/Idh/MocA family protein [Marinomonas mediterranea]|jgi:Predicted dehydrogenases and related proteins|uniref:Oxidoreductase domain protein n=1 Tax=Marinomonas mediterranea (strain ATCC 700492 / JCM 21426 / NBRC 103028 / MMB-1) TaxID=717774 RepID=F2K431_MARM1|nr:Gfo/Idh/MocA family oxidoreductase [Marinomonas mediterranea]ADZ91373.1 oxidoreductase domain protein [Marinomonas mediterranea MMB-1]WCN09345.1 Gfo/Idh/MocA family oxidoreductase [Marinomonas mediterranea]WCN13424.1 Gfo/Idh/MocA family oxidoreductase [Marinomonas mediterranea]WCN17490.1 Gfo/Idh/MocA family oxidoreductase [Marinomonas mediterranea MMB-1]